MVPETRARHRVRAALRRGRHGDPSDTRARSGPVDVRCGGGRIAHRPVVTSDHVSAPGYRPAVVTIALALLVRDGLVLLAHRVPSKWAYPDCWDLVGGVVESGELPDEAVTRECLEEIGVHVQDPLPIPYPVSDPDLEVHAFLVTRWDGEPVNAAPDEHDELRWFQPSELAGLEMAHGSSLSSILSAAQTALS